jgi:hypothetical protein
VLDVWQEVRQAGSEGTAVTPHSCSDVAAAYAAQEPDLKACLSGTCGAVETSIQLPLLFQYLNPIVYSALYRCCAAAATQCRRQS